MILNVNKILLPLLVYFLFFCSSAWAETTVNRQIAITIDDLPFVGDEPNFHLTLIIESLQKNHIPTTGFIIGDRAKPNTWPVLEAFRKAGFGLGNHTFTHLDLNHVEAQTYIENIDKADKLLQPLLTEPKYFRYPYLAMSQGEKKQKVLNYLIAHQYHIAPITIDSKDFIFNQQLLSVPELGRRTFLPELKPVYLDYILLQTKKAEQFNQKNHLNQRAQILLIHANLLNAYVLEDIIKLYQSLGYQFISLQDALKTFPTEWHDPKQPIDSPTSKPWVEPQASSSDLEKESFTVWD